MSNMKVITIRNYDNLYCEFTVELDGKIKKGLVEVSDNDTLESVHLRILNVVKEDE